MNDNIDKWDLIYKNKKWDSKFPERCIQDFYKYHLPSSPKNFKLLDVGCGSGIHSLFLQKKGFKVYGIDSSLTAIKLAKKRLQINKNSKIKQCSFEKINFPDAYFDGIISIGVLYYASYNQLKNGVKEIYRLLKPNSLARITLKTKRDHLFKAMKYSRKNSKVATEGWEKDILFTFLNKKSIKQLFKKFKKTTIGIEEFNYVNLKKLHSFWIVTVQK